MLKMFASDQSSRLCRVPGGLSKFAGFAAIALASLSSMSASAQCTPNWVQRTVTGPSAREDARMVYDPVSQQVILFGGANYTTGLRYNDTWAWNGTAWNQQFPTGTLPPPRSGQGMAYDVSRSRVALYGGNLPNNVTNYGDTWEYDGTSWTQVSTSGGSKRYAPGFAFDTNRNVIMLVAGQTDNNQSYRDAWAWDGSTWTRESTAGPINGYGISFDYDRVRKTAIFFGGTTYYGNLPRYNDTWEWNGLTWTKRTPATLPPVRRFAPMVFDVAREAMVLFGGDGANNVFLPDTWTWNGTNWTQLAVSGPSARRDAAMAYDEARGEIVLFGGFDTALRGDTWVLPSPLGIIKHPSNTGVCKNGAAFFQVKAVGVGNLTYQWRRNSEPIDPGINPSALNSTLALYGAQPSDEASYDVVVTGDCGSVTSSPATFSICRADFSCDGVVDDYDFTLFVFAYNLLACDDPDMMPGCPSDLNGDTVVDDADFVVFIQAYNKLVCS
ncbi:MAG: kelch repeat-containing protein [Phycisphaerales bacterium]